MTRIVGVLTLLVLALFTTPVRAQEGQLQTSFEVRDAAGQTVGTVTLVQVDQAVNVKGTFRNLPPGVHGIHLHAVGTCTPDFAAAGGHYNPNGKQHGLENPAGAHAGDLANLTINPDGTGTYDHTTQMVTLAPGPTSLYDADGTSLIIHAAADDYKTDPTGNSGGRIACGVVQAAQAGGGAGAAQPQQPGQQQPGQTGDTMLSAALSGPEEVPTPGDPDGTGTATVTLRAGNQVCWDLRVSNITLPAAAAHIHEAPRGVAGPVVVPLSPPDANGMASGCANAEAGLVERIRQNPGTFYVNVHTPDFPGGAVRGQLSMGAAQQQPAAGGDTAGQPAQQQPAAGAGNAGQPAQQPAPAALPNTGAGSLSTEALLGLALVVLAGGALVVRRSRTSL